MVLFIQEYKGHFHYLVVEDITAEVDPQLFLSEHDNSNNIEKSLPSWSFLPPCLKIRRHNSIMFLPFCQVESSETCGYDGN